jgi:hypothetical protein
VPRCIAATACTGFRSLKHGLVLLRHGFVGEEDGCVEVRLVYIDAFPNWLVASRRLRWALDRLGRADLAVSPVRVGTDEGAAAIGFAGSPTILIDGLDLFPPIHALTGGRACRLYKTWAGLAGAPTAEAILNALRERV